MKKRSLRVKEWRGRKRAQGLRPLSLWLDTATYGRLQAMAEREQVSPAAIVTQALRAIEPGGAPRQALPLPLNESNFGLVGVSLRARRAGQDRLKIQPIKPPVVRLPQA
jgi:hypothetical protein